jgi:hypothetical protein
MYEQIKRIKEKIKQLRELDKGFSLFGSQKHQYKINPVISLKKIREFEATHQITLPSDYVEFLTEIGNGGAGPFYGLEPIQNCLYDDLDYKRPDSLLNPSKPFAHTEPWNLEFQPTIDEDDNDEQYDDERNKFGEKYYDKEQMNGVLAICNFGCAVSLNLVVNGQEYGNIWTDDRGSDNGIYPLHELGNKGKITFLNWYELWLNNSIKEIVGNLPKQKIQVENEQTEKNKKPWWKIW